MCLHINQKAHIAYDLSFIIKSEGVLKVIGCNVHFRSGIISQTVPLNRDVL